MRSAGLTVIMVQRRAIIDQIAGRVLMPYRVFRMCMQLKAGDTCKPNRQEKHTQQKPAVPAMGCIQNEAPHEGGRMPRRSSPRQVCLYDDATIADLCARLRPVPMTALVMAFGVSPRRSTPVLAV
jgi:hypothetical protein